MWSFLLKLLPVVLGWFGIGTKSDAEIGLDKGEQLGKAETQAAADEQELKNVQKASDARGAVSDTPADIVRDPANSGPA